MSAGEAASAISLSLSLPSSKDDEKGFRSGPSGSMILPGKYGSSRGGSREHEEGRDAEPSDDEGSSGGAVVSRGGDRTSGAVYSPLSIEEGRNGDDDQGAEFRRCGNRGGRRPPFLCCRRRLAIAVAAAFLLLAASVSAVVRLFPAAFPWRRWFSRSSRFGTAAVCPSSGAPPDGTIRVRPEDMNLDRAARSLPDIAGAERLHGAHAGFVWDDDDAETAEWRPQGVTTVTSGGRKFALVSWYGRQDQAYEDRGARVTFVDMTDMPGPLPRESDIVSVAAAAPPPDAYRYRHVLLVDENFCTLPALHAGGLMQIDGRLHVPDSRWGSKVVLVFDLFMELYHVPESSDDFFGHRYVLRKGASYEVPTVPSFLSHDADRNLTLVGTYRHCGSRWKSHTDQTECRNMPGNALAWLPSLPGNTDGDAARKGGTLLAPFFSDMQGAISLRLHPPVNNKDGDEGKLAATVEGEGILLVSSSYGALYRSHLHIVRNFDPPLLTPTLSHSKDNAGWEGTRNGNYTTFEYPPGLEDLHMEKVRHGNNSGSEDGDGNGGSDSDGALLWALTEFPPRTVFVTELLRIIN